jgi:ketosteroid isomerase-like protein
MNEQVVAWNKGNIEGFMTDYWHSDSLRFIGSKGITRGWQQTLDNYKKGYPTTEAMGQLSFEIKSIEQLSATAIFVVGKWHLQKTGSEAGGYYTLLWKKINGHWLIVLDHTS